MRSTLMTIDMNGPDIEALDEVKELILESVDVWKNYKKMISSRMISFQKVMVKSRQVLHPFLTL